MSATQTKTLSPAELAKLEHAFASEPGSDAYKPLAEAYMSMSRYMEAMVVCKKGVKAHPQSAEPRVLLARVYAEQGKDKKALEELQSALQIAPADPAALRMDAVLQLKTGEAEAGKASLLKAFQADPSNAETLALMQAHGVAAPQAAAPVQAAPVQAAPASAAPVLTPVGAPPVLQPVGTPAPQGSVSTRVPAAEAPASRGAAPSATARRSQEGLPAVASARRSSPGTPAVRSPPPRRAAPVAVDDDDDLPRRRASATSGGQRLVFLGLVVALPLLAGGYWVLRDQAKKRTIAVGRALSSATEELKHDSFDSYMKVCKAAEEAVAIDPDSAMAHGYLAYAYTIRWTEHGGGDESRLNAERHLKLASELDGAETSSHLLSARALYALATGKGTEAVTSLKATVESFEAQRKQSSLLYLTLGIVQMNLGDLEGARENLEAAQAVAPADPRIYAALGTLYRRRGQDSLSEQNFDFALRYERNHPESLLGKAQLVLQQDAPDYAAASDLLKKLLDASPPPSPRQLAMASMARSLLIGRVLADLPQLGGGDQRKLLEATGIPTDRAAAQAELEKAEKEAFALGGQNPELNVIRGRRLNLAGQTDAAIEELRKAVKLDPMRAQFHMELARALMEKRGGEAEAAGALETALKAMGDSPKLLVLYGDALRRQGKLDAAIVQYTKALGDPKDPKNRNPEARTALGSTLREKRDFTRAQTELELAAKELFAQPSRLAVALTELGRTYQATSEADKADEAFKRALTSDGAYAPAYFHYARFMADARRETARASTLAQEYLKLAPRGEFASDAQRLVQ